MQKLNPEITALVLVDIQNDFLPPSGSLAIPNGDAILPVVHQVLELDWALIIASQDYHPPDHISFASNHQQEAECPPKIDPNSGIALWPDHCVQGTIGCEIENGIKKLLSQRDQLVQFVKKGQDPQKEEYSAFDSSGTMDKLLKSRNISTLVCMGLAADYCLVATARSALTSGYEVYWLSSGTQAVGGQEVQCKIEAELINEFPESYKVINLEELQSYFQ
ncbi:uncharacterized protein MELLADRAFT_105481 [Melampsora larici-populina 98AG31]|uniref:nicotinamidase n=1 Tax=Melampsora larici-populina (strain 98AG31 / pathotype 3-4-7) TaxID=747676 RepID=F4RI96_MELLP|nr:uncharacterized protein MELLADRAFT_105481 [Melampsora larici-populina 98AG31]EGG07969.1 hypothetical protein MELLADRAFT_105481 [Melampsora larici-populina 98AG31]